MPCLEFEAVTRQELLETGFVHRFDVGVHGLDEAVAESRGVRLAEPVKAAAVKGLIDDSEKAKSKERSVGPSASLITREDKDNVMVESRDKKSDTVIHKTYVRKN